MTGGPQVAYVLPPAVAIAVALALVAVVFTFAPASRSRNLFAGMLGSLIMWGIAVLGMRLSSEPTEALLWNRWTPVALYILFLFFLRFAREYTNTHDGNRFLIAGYIGLLVLLVAAPAGLLMEGLRIEDYGYAPVAGPLAVPAGAAGVLLLLAGAITLGRRYRVSSSEEEKTRLLYLTVAAILPLVGALLDVATNLPPVGIWTSLAFCVICSVALLKYRLLDIPVVARRVLTYLVLGVLIAVPYVATLFVLQRVLGARLDSNWSFVITVLFLALVLRPLYGAAQAVVDRAFYRNRYEALRALERFSREAQHSVDLQSLAKEVTSLVVEALHAGHACLFLSQQEGGDLELAHCAGLGIPPSRPVLSARGALVRWLTQHPGILAHRMLDIEPQLQSLSQREQNLLTSMGASIILPVASAGGQLAGLLTLGEKASHRPYSGDDRRLLETLGNQLSVSLDNARLYNDAVRARRDLERWLDGMEDSVLIVAPDRTIRFANRSAREDLGVEDGMPCWRSLGHDKPCAVCSLIETWAGGAGSTRLSRHIGERDYDVVAAPLLEPDGAASLIAVLRDVTSRNLIEAELRHSQAQLRELAAHQETVREEERRGIARELHDELGQYLTALKMDIAALSRHAPTNAHEEAREKLSGMKSVVEDTIGAVQRMSSQLRPGILDDLGLVPALEWLARDFQERSGLICRLDVDEELSFDERYSTALFRICQESLTNVARHSHATMVSIRLRREDSSVVLTVTDNGRGIPKAQLDDPHSFGVIGMRERARALGGEAYFESVPGGGTVVRVVLPFPSEPLPNNASQ